MCVGDEMRNEAIEVPKVLNTPPMCTGEQLFSPQGLQTTSFQQFKYMQRQSTISLTINSKHTHSTDLHLREIHEDIILN